MLFLKSMAYYHLIAKVGSEERCRELFTDLTEKELTDCFVRYYEKGDSFFSGNNLISPYDLRSINIIRTLRKNEVEWDEINRNYCERINRLNNPDDGLFVIDLGRGYEPQDIADAGEDLTHTFIKGSPGFKAGRWKPWQKVFAWVAGIVATIIAAGIIKWLGWV